MSDNKWRDTFIRLSRANSDDDPASFRSQRDQAYKAISELFALYEVETTEVRRLHKTVARLGDPRHQVDGRDLTDIRRSRQWLQDNPS